MIKKILRPTTVISCRTMQEDWEGFDFWRKNFLKKKKKLIFSIFFFDLFFGAPSCRLYSPLQVGLNIFGFSDLPHLYQHSYPGSLNLSIFTPAKSVKLIKNKLLTWLNLTKIISFEYNIVEKYLMSHFVKNHFTKCPSISKICFWSVCQIYL